LTLVRATRALFALQAYKLVGRQCLFKEATPAAVQCLQTLKMNLTTATAASSLIACFLMGFFANLPLALAPGMGEATDAAPRARPRTLLAAPALQQRCKIESRKPRFLLRPATKRSTKHAPSHCVIVCPPTPHPHPHLPAGINIYVAYQVVGQGDLTYEQAMTAIFVEGWIFILLSLTGVRGGIIKYMPPCVSFGTSVGIGLLLAFTGLRNLGVVVFDATTLVTLGGCDMDQRLYVYTSPDALNATDLVAAAALDESAPTVYACTDAIMRSATMWLGIGGGVLMALLAARGVKGALFIGIAFVTVISWIPGHGASYLGAGSSIPGGETRMEVSAWPGVLPAAAAAAAADCFGGRAFVAVAMGHEHGNGSRPTPRTCQQQSTEASLAALRCLSAWLPRPRCRRPAWPGTGPRLAKATSGWRSSPSCTSTCWTARERYWPWRGCWTTRWRTITRRSIAWSPGNVSASPAALSGCRAPGRGAARACVLACLRGW
jgi:hypothetical protein